ncbi:hypothetical protein [Chitinibacter tainanensis]|uniref:hypothetical protein n=1 Tax=Chitinibacter tainanensis TaxID=230667 RepID=UPI000558A717|nr:hypothetical protein [Chitinibacter tainanensis]
MKHKANIVAACAATLLTLMTGCGETTKEPPKPVSPNAKYYTGVKLEQIDVFDLNDCQRAMLAGEPGISKDLSEYLSKVIGDRPIKEWQEEQYQIYACKDEDKKITADGIASVKSENYKREHQQEQRSEPSVGDCVSRGIEYFKENGSYPVLKTEPNAGRSAYEVAVERCNRTTTAF